MPRPAARLLLCLSLAALLAAAGGAREAAAQTVVWKDAPLADVLADMAARAGVDLVYAVRLVRDRRVSGRYTQGEEPARALARLLFGTGVLAQPLRPGQYVLIAAPLNVVLGGDDGPEATTGTLDGRVVDAETGESLPGASVFLVDVGLGAVADLQGAFGIENLPAGRYTARVTYVGYRGVRVSLDVYPDSPRLPPVVRLQPEPVSSFVAEVKAGAADAGPMPGVTDVAARGVAASGSPLGRGDLGAALAALPGLTRTGGASGRLVVRGADPDALRVLRDGVPLYAPWHAGGLASVLQPEALGRVVLHRGQSPAALGGGLAAVLETETTSALAGDTTATAGLSPVAARAVADVALGRSVGLHVGALRSVLGPWLAPSVRAGGGVWAVDPLGGRRGDALRPDVSVSSAEAALNVRLGPAARLDVSAWSAQDRVRLAGVGPARADTARVSERSWAASARLRGLVGRRTFGTVSAYRTRLDADARLADGGAPGAPESTQETLRETAVGLDVDRALSLHHTLGVGLRVTDRRVAGVFDGGPAGGSVEDRQGGTELALYAADTWTPGMAVQVQAGLRVEAWDALRGTAGRRVLVSPRLFARWRAVPDRLVLRAGLSRQTQAVQRLVREAGPRPLAGARWAVAGADARAASAWQAGAGAEWAPTGRLVFSADVYGRLDRDVLRDALRVATPADRLAGFAPASGRAAGLDVAARLFAGAWTFSLAGAVSSATMRVRGASWRPAPYSRPLAGGLLAERGVGPLALGLRLDAASGLPRAAGGREAADVRAGVAVGATAKPFGLRVTALAQAQIRLYGPAQGDRVDPALLAPLAESSRALPAWPTVSVLARW